MAAGLGFKTFTTGEVLTAADTNGYLMQGINVFASSAARAAAITSPQEGQYSYLKDTNALEYYDGAAWVGAPVGDITAVTAGKGLTGGGSSGDVTVSLATTAKGDLVAGSGASTAAVLTVGNNGETLVADSSTATGLRYQGNFAAGKNKIINGDFGIWQRGTSVTPASGFGYGADRWRTYSFGSSTSTLSQQSFTAGTAPVAGYEGQYFGRFASTNTVTYASQPIEDVRTFAGQTVTVSFWAKSASAQTLANVKFDQNFGSGGSGTVSTAGTAPAITTSWARYSVTISVPSISGKTIGAGSNLDLIISGAINNNLDLWGVQVEAGSVATAFQTATGTIQGELAACQRYYYSYPTGTLGCGSYYSTTLVITPIALPVPMRVAPTGISNNTATGTVYVAGNARSISSYAWNGGNTRLIELNVTSVADTAGRVGTVTIDSGSIGISAEL